MAKATLETADDIADVYEVGDYSIPSPSVAKTDAEQRTDDLSDALRDDQNAFATIHKEDNGRSIHVERIPADKYDMGQLLDYLQLTYGGGDYRVRVYAKGKITANKLLSIAHKLKRENGENAQPSTGGEVAQVLNTILTTITDQNRRMIEAIQGQQQSKSDMLQEMMLFKQLFDNGSNSSGNGLSQIKDTVEVLSGLGINVGLPAPEEKDAGFSDLLEKFTPVITAAMQPNAQQRPPQHQQNSKERDSKMGFQNAMIKAGITTLINAAKKGADPSVYASMIVDQLPEAKVKEFLVAPDAAKKLVTFAPPVKDHAQWFDELAEHVKAILGMQSRYSDLYEGEDSVINGQTQDDEPPTNGTTD